MLWRAKAANQGHVIARAQMTAITGASVVQEQAMPAKGFATKIFWKIQRCPTGS